MSAQLMSGAFPIVLKVPVATVASLIADTALQGEQPMIASPTLDNETRHLCHGLQTQLLQPTA
jgi:hypothetical protein